MSPRALVYFAPLFVFVLISNAAYAAVEPVALWPAEGNTTDRMGNYDGLLGNEAGYGAGRIGQAFNFDGVDDYVFVPNTTTIDGGPLATYMAWVYPNSLPTSGQYYSFLVSGEPMPGTLRYEQARLLYMNESGSGVFYVDCGTGNNDGYRYRTTAGNYAPGNWYFVVAVFDNGNLDLYVNGVLDNGAAGGYNPSNFINDDVNNYVSIGAQVSFDESAINTPFDGLVDEPAIFDTALGASDVAGIYLEGLTGTIVLEKQTDPNDPNDTFLFDVSSIDPNNPTSVLEDDDAVSFADVPYGLYRVSELLPGGWSLNNVSCIVDTGNNDSFDPNDPNDPTGYDIVLNPGQTTTCTYYNRQFRADLSVTKDANSPRVSAGENITYTITVANNGPDSATDVMATDALPAGLGFVSATPSQGSCFEMGGTVECDLGTIADQGTATIDLVVQPLAPGEYENTVTVTTSGLDADGAAGAAPAVLAAGSQIPTLDEWALMMLALLLAMAGFVAVRR